MGARCCAAFKAGGKSERKIHFLTEKEGGGGSGWKRRRRVKGEVRKLKEVSTYIHTHTHTQRCMQVHQNYTSLSIYLLLTDAEACKLEALSVCCFEFFWQDFGGLPSPTPLQWWPCYYILWAIYVHGKSHSVWRALDVFSVTVFSLSSTENSFSECSSLAERCSDSLPAQLWMHARKHGCAQAAIKSAK